MKLPITRAALSIAALITIAILANWLISLTPFGNRGADFTENKIHTLSQGTKSILGELDTPVSIRYYATRNSDYMPETLKLHIKHIDDLLKEYSNLSKGKLHIENLDPQPDTDAEDSANLDSIRGEKINGDNLYLGLTISALDKKVILPFLSPAEETMLEYQISKAIAEVSTAIKPTIGVISALDLAGTQAIVPGQQNTPPWVIYKQLQQTFDLQNLGMTPEKIDPAQTKVLLLIHPSGISPETEFLIDQYLLQGGTVVACLDAHSLSAEITNTRNATMGQRGIPAVSTLPTLLKAWGIEFTASQVLADPEHATLLEGDRKGIAVLTLPQSSMPQKDSIITENLESVTFYLPGAFKNTGAEGISATSLIQSSTNAGFVDSAKAARLDPSLNNNIKPENTNFDLVTHLTGTFKTAFPQGNPNPQNPEGESTTSSSLATPLATATKPGNVFLIADIDAFYDAFAYSIQNLGGIQMANPVNANSSLLLNLLDQAVGSKYLIGSRSRAATRRPFTLIQRMEANFERQTGDKIYQLEEKQEQARKKLRELQAKKTEGSELFLSPEQESEIVKFRQQQVEYSRLIREQQKDLRRQKDSLAGDITLLNIALMPGFVILIGLSIFLKRRTSTRPR